MLQTPYWIEKALAIFAAPSVVIGLPIVAVADVTIGDLLNTTGIGGIMLAFTWIVFRYITEQRKEAREERQQYAEAAERRDHLFAETLRGMGAECHETQRKANETIERVAGVVDRGVKVIERQERALKNAERSNG